MKYWKIISSAIASQLNEWEVKQLAGRKALKELRDSLGAEDIACITSFFTGMPTDAYFRFPDGTVFDYSKWTRADKNGLRRPKRNKSTKDLRDRIEAVLSSFGNLSVILHELKIDKKQFDGLTLWIPQFLKKDRTWYIAARDNYDGCELVERISDIEMEKLFPAPKPKRKSKVVK